MSGEGFRGQVHGASQRFELRERPAPPRMARPVAFERSLRQRRSSCAWSRFNSACLILLSSRPSSTREYSASLARQAQVLAAMNLVVRQRAAAGGLRRTISVNGEFIRVDAVEKIEGERRQILVPRHTDVISGRYRARVAALISGLDADAWALGLVHQGQRRRVCRSSITVKSALKSGKIRTPSAIFALSIDSLGLHQSRCRCCRSICALITSECATSPPCSCFW